MKSERPEGELLRIGALPSRELEARMLRGETPDPDRLAGWEYRGLNAPAWSKLVGIRDFIKGFFKGPTGQVYGYNIRWKDADRPRRFGFYRVDLVDAAQRDNAYLHALLLDYGRGGNHELDPTSGLRDYLVRVERGSDDLLLGKAYYALGPLRVPASFFVLQRLRPTEYRR